MKLLTSKELAKLSYDTHLLYKKRAELANWLSTAATRESGESLMERAAEIHELDLKLAPLRAAKTANDNAKLAHAMSVRYAS